MDNRIKPDICVIGAGSGGLSVAAAAAAFGVSVVLVEKGRMGGDCLNYGCVPSKALLAAGKMAHALEEAPAYGVEAGGKATVTRRKVNEHVEAAQLAIAPNDSEERFTSLGVHVIRKPAHFTNPHTVMAGKYQIEARRFVIATGSSPFVPPIPGLEETGYLTNETVFEVSRKIPHLIVIGGGPIGMEMAQAHLRLGSRVTVLEGDRALNKEDPEMADVVLEQMRREGATIREHSKVSRVEKAKSGVSVVIDTEEGEETISGSDILVATGREANIADLGLDVARIRHDRHGIKVNKYLRTSNRRVYAIGDVAGALQFTHVAGYHAAQVVKSILFRFGGRVDLSAIPRVTFTDPELAHVGMTEDEARAGRRKFTILRWPYHENDRAQAEGRTQGHIKIVVGGRGRILGASIAGAMAGEMIHLWTFAVARNLKLRDMMDYVAPYPTFSEIGRRAAVSYYAPMAGNRWVRRLLAVMRLFG